MIKKVLVAPSILSGDFANMAKSVADLEEWGADYVHCDVMDGNYVPNITFGMPMVAALSKITKLPLDVHLMIDKPERYIDSFIDSGADIITFHPDACEKPLETLKNIQKRGIKSGIVFNPNIDFENYKALVPYCDMILVMSVYAGFGGQKFIEDTYEKINKIKKYITDNKLNVLIEIDGGVTEENSKKLIDTGVDILVSGSTIFKSANPKKTIENLKLS